MELLVYLTLALPFGIGALTLLVGWRTFTSMLAPLGALAILVFGCVLGTDVAAHGPLSVALNVLRVDALSSYMIIVIGAVATIATVHSVSYIRHELHDGEATPRTARYYGVFVQFFIGCMLLATLANNLGVLWIAIEATTITTAFLVNHRRTAQSLEASWKYVVIGSVGVALAFLGTVLVYFASAHASPIHQGTVLWTDLVSLSHTLDPGVMRLAIALIILGFGTKVGLAPMHTWLPDAHSQAPAPVSALMSGVLLSVAFVAILRYKVIADAALGTGHARAFLFLAGFTSLVVAVLLMISQRDYKRMLAYSSIEHMGIIAIGAAVGTRIAITAVLLHIFAHAIIKSGLFSVSGEIMQTTGTTSLDELRGLIRSQPSLGVLFATGLVGLVGMPPFALFVSEILLVTESVRAGFAWAASALVVMLIGAFVALFWRTREFLFGDPVPLTLPRPRLAVVLLLTLTVLTAAVFGLTLYPIQTMLFHAAEVIAR